MANQIRKRLELVEAGKASPAVELVLKRYINMASEKEIETDGMKERYLNLLLKKFSKKRKADD